jgi:peptide deformylase
LKLASKEIVEGCTCTEVTREDISLFVNNGMIREMLYLMKTKNGIGLASPQVGIFKRFFVMKLQDGFIYCFNPKIIYKSSQKSAMKEGCLTYNTLSSKPTVNIMRPKSIGVEYTDEEGNLVQAKLHGINAKCFQHEMDHLDGKTIMFNPDKGRK